MELIKCACGCGRVRPKYDKQNRKRKYILGHQYYENQKKILEERAKKGVWNIGLTKETDIRMKLSAERSAKSRIGHLVTKETRRKLGLDAKGNKHPNFNNWSSREPYGKEFSPELKEYIRQKYQYRCQECFRHQEELFRVVRGGKKRHYNLYIHHIDYNKQNNNPINLISLCIRCHIITNKNRIFWQRYFTMYQFIKLLQNKIQPIQIRC